MAHEMGHYVLNHIYKGLLEMGLVLTIGFAFVAWGFQRIVARRGRRGASVRSPTRQACR